MDQILTFVVEAIWLMLPAYIGNMSAVPFGGGKPLDLGRDFLDGRRVFGNGKTFRGTTIYVFIALVVGTLQRAPMFGLFLGVGAAVGDVTGSFIKRRIGLKQGDPAPLLDQLDFAVGALVFASLITRIEVSVVITIIIITPILHVLTNRLGCLLELKGVPW